MAVGRAGSHWRVVATLPSLYILAAFPLHLPFPPSFIIQPHLLRLNSRDTMTVHPAPINVSPSPFSALSTFSSKPSSSSRLALPSPRAFVHKLSTLKLTTLTSRLLKHFTRLKDEEEAARATALAAERNARPRPPRQPYLSYLCFDVEGSCEAATNFDYPNEIIVSCSR